MRISVVNNRVIRGISSAALVAGLLATPAFAQAGSADDNQQSADSGSEIVVTAQKREERLQDVPISISVLSGANLDKSTSSGAAEELSRVPGVAIYTHYQSGGPQVMMRGVTSGTALFGGSTPVAYYVDSVPFALVRTPIVPDVNAFDMERIEVLRGPQGTLYGASALNGVVRILTSDADLNEFEGKARGSISNTRYGGWNYRADAALSVPIIEGKLAARVSAGYQKSSGWIDRLNDEDANDAEVSSLRFKLNAQPTDNLSIVASAWLSRSDYGAPSVSDDRRQHTIATLHEPISVDFDTYSLSLEQQFSAFSVKSVTSYITYDNSSELDLLGEAFGIPSWIGGRLNTSIHAEVFSQEVTLGSSVSGPWRWSAGANYRNAKDSLSQENRNPAGSCCGYFGPAEWTNFSESFAIYGELTRQLFDGKLELTGGLRYFEDHVALKERSREVGSVPPGQLINVKTKFDAVSPRAILTWHPSDNSTLYASYGKGFRSGWHQTPSIVAAAPEFRPVDADTLTNYELGAKGSAWDGRLTFDAALYFQDWQDVQQTLLVQISPGIFNTAGINGESASGFGFDLGLSIKPATGLTFGANVSLNDLTLDADVRTGTGVLLVGKGGRLAASPELTLGGFIDYAFPLGSSGFKGRLEASANYTSELAMRTLSGSTVFETEGDDMLIGRLGLTVEAPARWRATLYVDNITDEGGAYLKRSDAFLSPTSRLTDFDSRVRPRTIGLQIDFRY